MVKSYAEMIRVCPEKIQEKRTAIFQVIINDGRPAQYAGSTNLTSLSKMQARVVDSLIPAASGFKGRIAIPM